MTSFNDSPVIETNLPIGEPVRGKVHDCYRLNVSDEPHMLIVSTDRVSAFDWVLPTPIPGKGKVLTAVSNFWFGWLSEHSSPVSHHLVTTDVDEMDLPSTINRELIRGRSMLVIQLMLFLLSVWCAGGSRDQACWSINSLVRFAVFRFRLNCVRVIGCPTLFLLHQSNRRTRRKCFF